MKGFYIAILVALTLGCAGGKNSAVDEKYQAKEGRIPVESIYDFQTPKGYYTSKDSGVRVLYRKKIYEAKEFYSKFKGKKFKSVEVIKDEEQVRKIIKDENVKAIIKVK